MHPAGSWVVSDGPDHPPPTGRRLPRGRRGGNHSAGSERGGMEWLRGTTARGGELADARPGPGSRGGGRRVCHGASATSAPVDHASRASGGRTVRLPRHRRASGAEVFQTDPQAESRDGCLRWCGVVKNGCPRPGPNALRPSLSARPRPGHPPRRGGRPGSSPATAGPPLSAAARRSRSGRRTSPPSLPPASGRAGRGRESDQVALEAR